MKILRLLSILLLTQEFVFGQITGNPNVRDLKAIELDSAKTKLLVGKWTWIKFEEIRRDQERVIEEGTLITFNSNGTIIIEDCFDVNPTSSVQYSYKGLWKILPNNTVELTFDEIYKKNKLESFWVVYNLTANEMSLVRIMTSNGDWRIENKFQK